MQPWTEWIINVKISFSAESNKLPMIWLSERLVAWIRKTPRSRGAISSPPWVIDSCTVLTFWWWWLREPEPDWSPDSASLEWATGPHSKPILGDLCPEHGVVVDPQLSDLEILIAVLMWNSGCWEKGSLDCCFFCFSVASFCLFCCLALSFSLTFCVCGCYRESRIQK